MNEYCRREFFCFHNQSRNPENDAAGAVAVAKEFGGPETQPQVHKNQPTDFTSNYIYK